MSALEQLRKLSSAEDFFETLGVSYDPAVLRVARLHILRRMGEYLFHSGAGRARTMRSGSPAASFSKTPTMISWRPRRSSSACSKC